MPPLSPHVSFTILQPSNLKFLLSRHLATNSFDLWRVFYKSSCQLQNLGRHGEQNGSNLEGCPGQCHHSYLHLLRIRCLLHLKGNFILQHRANFTCTPVSSYILCTFLPETLCDSVHKQHHQHPCSHQIPGKERSMVEETCM